MLEFNFHLQLWELSVYCKELRSPLHEGDTNITQECEEVQITAGTHTPGDQRTKGALQ